MRLLGALLALLALAGCDAFTAHSGDMARTDQYACRDPQQPPLPRLSGRVVDAADLLTADREQALAQRLAAFEARTRRQPVIVTVPTLHGKTVEDYTLRLANCRGIGRAGHDDGVVLLVAPTERKLRIEIGKGLEKTFTNEEAAKIVAVAIERFRADDFAGGIDGATTGIIDETGGAIVGEVRG